MEKSREFQKNISFCFIDCAKAFDPVDHHKLWKTVKEMGIPDHLTSYWEICMQIRKQQLDLDMEQQFQIRKAICQGCILSPWLFSLYAEFIMRNAGLDEAQAGIEIARRNINNLRYADDTTLMAES